MNFNSLYNIICEGSAIRSYSCLMLDCSQFSEQLKTLQADINTTDIYTEESGHGLETEFHITVLYGIHSQIPSDVLKSIKLYPCKFKFSKISSFNNEKYDVLKFDIESKDLHSINKEIREKIPYTNQYETYIPHATIGYLLPGCAKKYKSLKSDLLGKSFTSNTFIFSDANSNKVLHQV